jgi:hypothetical protein
LYINIRKVRYYVKEEGTWIKYKQYCPIRSLLDAWGINCSYGVKKGFKRTGIEWLLIVYIPLN